MQEFMCPTAVIWGYGKTYNQNLNLIKYQEIRNLIKIVGITGKDIYHTYIDGYPCIPITDLRDTEFDYLIISAQGYYSKICEEAVELGIERNSIIDIQVFNIPNFNFLNYIKLVKSHISIIANNCWGGVTYHLLRMQFLSPFINMFVRDKDYIKLLKDLKILQEKIEFIGWNCSSELEREYPIYNLGRDISLHFNHYVSQEEVEFKWYERLKRINWNNLFVMMWTEDVNIAQQFDELDYEKKICFVPFNCNLKSAYTLANPNGDIKFWEVVNGVPLNRIIDYNVIDMLCGIGRKHDRLVSHN